MLTHNPQGTGSSKRRQLQFNIVEGMALLEPEGFLRGDVPFPCWALQNKEAFGAVQAPRHEGGAALARRGLAAEGLTTNFFIVRPRRTQGSRSEGPLHQNMVKPGQSSRPRRC